MTAKWQAYCATAGEPRKRLRCLTSGGRANSLHRSRELNTSSLPKPGFPAESTVEPCFSNQLLDFSITSQIIWESSGCVNRKSHLILVNSIITNPERYKFEYG